MNQASLPIHFGAIKIRRAEDINLSAFHASTFGARTLVANLLNSLSNDISIH